MPGQESARKLFKFDYHYLVSCDDHPTLINIANCCHLPLLMPCLLIISLICECRHVLLNTNPTCVQ